MDIRSLNEFTGIIRKAVDDYGMINEGDKVAVRTTDCDKIKECIEKNSARPVPAWLDKDAEKMTVNVTKLPERADIDFDIEEHLIVELYSK